MLNQEGSLCPSRRTVRLSDRHLAVAYMEQGHPEGLPVLLLHGNLGSKRWWLPLFDVLPAEFRLIAPDMRGCGETASCEDAFAVAHLASDLQGFAEALSLNDYSLVAHSTSCAVALEYALRCPHRLHCLVLIASPPLNGIATPPMAYRALQSVLQTPDEAAGMLRSLMPHLDLERPSNQALFDGLVDDARNMHPKAVDGITRGLEAWSCVDRVAQLAPPLLLVRGEADQVAPHDMTLRILLAIPGANNLEIIRGAGHAPMIENPAALAVRLIDFIVQDFNELEALRAG